MKDLHKIVDLIIKELFETNKINDPKKKIIFELLKSGIPPEDINQALFFIVEKINHSTGKKILAQAKKNRILTTRESSRFSREASKCLYDYYYNDTISWWEMEKIINVVERMDRIVDVTGLNRLMEKVVFSQNVKNVKIDHSVVH